jgi:GPH family glycoside/pentoside/hexuronide:cation symporter
LLPELTEDEQERNSFQIFASFFNLLGMIIGFILPELFRGGSSFFLILSMIAIGILGAALIMYTTYQFEERPEFQLVDEPLGFSDSIKATFKSKAFVSLVSANFMGVLMQSLIIGSLYFLADYVVHESSIVLMIFIFLPLIIGIWVTPKLIDKWGVVKADQYLLMIGGSGLILLTFMPVALIYLFLAIAAIGFVGPLVFTNVLFAQVCDEDEINTGVRREAMFFGINALITKPAQSLAIVIPTALLSAVNFIPHALGTPPVFPQPAGVDIVIRLFIGLIPGIGLLFSAFILQFYPIKGEYWKKIQKDILILHEKKHAKWKEMERK